MKHLRYSCQAAMDAQEHRHPQEVMQALGINAMHATPQSITDAWWFWCCENIPSELPKYLTEMELEPTEAVGHGLTLNMARLLTTFAQAHGTHNAAAERVERRPRHGAGMSDETKLRASFEQWCSTTCSPGASSSEWYWRMFRAGAAAAQQVQLPQNAPLRYTADTDAARDVLKERARQVSIEGWTLEHDDDHDEGQLAGAAAAYAMHAADVISPASQGDGGWSERPPEFWPWDAIAWKPSGSGTNQQGARRDLVKAGALILAEIERIDRAAAAATEPKGST